MNTPRAIIFLHRARITIALLASSLLVVWSISNGAHAMTADKLFAKVEPSVWLVLATASNTSGGSTGSAVITGPETMVTNCHVIKGMNRIRVHHQGVRLDATLQYIDAPRDLCQLNVPRLNAPAVAIVKVSTLVVGQRVYAIGAPRGLEATLSDGLISALRRDARGQIEFIQTTAPISSGSSGGGLFDEEGGLIGITSQTLVPRGDSGVAQNLNFARPAEQIFDLERRHQAGSAEYPQVSPIKPSIVASVPPESPRMPPSSSPGMESAPGVNGAVRVATLNEQMLNHREWIYPHSDVQRYGNVTFQFDDGNVVARNSLSTSHGTYTVADNRLCLELTRWGRQCYWLVSSGDGPKVMTARGKLHALTIR